jgi:hypothetical protein
MVDLASRLVDSPLHDHPPKSPEEGVDVERTPFSHSAVHFSGKSLPTSLSLPTVEDYVNVRVFGKTLFQRCVHEGITARDDE